MIDFSCSFGASMSLVLVDRSMVTVDRSMLLEGRPVSLVGMDWSVVENTISSLRRNGDDCVTRN